MPFMAKGDKMKTILITGGAGHIGTNVATEAIERGYKVISFDNLWRVEVSNNVKYMQEKYKDKYQFIWGDIRNREDFDVLPEVDAIIHLAANPGAITSIHYPLYDFKSNAEGTVNVLEFARKRGKLPVVYASTTKTMTDIINEIPMDETETRYIWKSRKEWPTEEFPFSVMANGITFEGDMPVAINDKFPIDGFGKWGHSCYGVSKLTGELYCQEYHVTYGLPVVMLRMSGIYGLWQKGVCEQGWASFFIRQIVNGDGKIPIFGTGKQVRDVLWAGDVARAYLDILENIDRVGGMVYTIGGGKNFTISLLEAVKIIEELSGKKATLTFDKKRPADHDVYISCIKKVEKELGWQPKVSPQEGLKRMIEEIS